MNGKLSCAPVTAAFEARDIDGASFDHAAHVRVAFDLLCKHDFIDAASIYAKGLRAITEKLGVPQKFNLTITYAFMSLIAERMASEPRRDFDTFVSANVDLMSRSVLENFYTPERLHSERARAMFLLPEVA